MICVKSRKKLLLVLIRENCYYSLSCTRKYVGFFVILIRFNSAFHVFFITKLKYALEE